MIYVVRHGETDLNKEGRLQGRQGMPLNENGIRQAECLRDKLSEIKFDYVYSSPQERAVQTAEIVTGIQASIDLRLDVYDLGEADGLKKSDVKWSGVIPDGRVYKGVEEIHSFIKRVSEFMHELEDKADVRDVNILVSGHRCTTGCIGGYFKGLPEDGDILRFSSENGDYREYNFNSSADL
ncbi:histidine phosphatase family protein [Paenibacillus wynnii]|uniref:Phosphoglycerate mutase n=1 Tax=Paenibacillus wynnii TaxID=268407 RepID=A0A098M458_9BACL|nr:histidine phosphatase family protein [Paenibacillus wynnii]KGE16836.1 phosphoglycerate mutase [Paenibacillus wynnii]